MPCVFDNKGLSVADPSPVEAEGRAHQHDPARRRSTELEPLTIKLMDFFQARCSI